MADWWRAAVIYQVYPRSFADASGDGIGDIAGIRSRLPYLAGLGVDAIWVSPWYLSPQEDGGYDVADFRQIDPLFGDLAEAEALIRDAHDRGLRVIADIVPNHVSREHPWFRAALRTPPGSPEWSLFHAVRGRGAGGEVPPNDWPSVFGGSAWDPILDQAGRPTGSWYLHLFDSSQPDLNWEHRAVRAEFEGILRFWFDRGLDGFRIDVASALVKAPGYPDDGVPARAERGLETGTRRDQPQWHQGGVHEIWRSWRRIAEAYDPPRMFVGEVAATDPALLAEYLRPDELQTAFNFRYLMAPWSAGRLREVVDDSLAATARVGAPTTWVLECHDQPRIRTRFALEAAGLDVNNRASRGDDARGARRGRAATLFMLGLPGSAYLYQGQELGLREVVELEVSARRDPAFARTGGEDGLRDGCRVPSPWTTAGPSCGFSPTGRTWLPMPPDWAGSSVERQAGDPASTLVMVREALRHRRAETALGSGSLAWVGHDDPDVLVLRRPGTEPATDVLVAMNLGEREAMIPGTCLLVGSGPGVREQGAGVILPPDAAAWLRG